MEQNKKLSADKIIIILIVVAFVVLVAGIFITKRNGQKQIDGKYALTYGATASDGSDASITVYVNFDSDTGDYSEYWNDSVFSTGTYTYSNNVITVKTDAGDDYDSEEIRYLVDGDVLVPEDYLYEGEIPEGKTFSAEVTMDDQTTVTTASFTEDGKFTVSVKSDTTESEVTGTYTRDGNYIYRTKDDGSELTPFYIYDGSRLAGIAYNKQ